MEAESESLPNLGREAHTYLHHIVQHYDQLATVTVFCQGHPFDHAPDFHARLKAVTGGEMPDLGFRWYGFLIDEDDQAGVLFARWSKNTDGRGLDLGAFHSRLFGDAAPDAFRFFGGAQFAVTADRVRSRPRSFYERALSLSLDYPDAAHCFERCWDRLFGVDGIPEHLRSKPCPIHLKPVKRLQSIPASTGSAQKG